MTRLYRLLSQLFPSYRFQIVVSRAIYVPDSLEIISKPHLSPDGCVEGLFKMLTYSPPCMLRFIIGLRLALERDLRF